MASIILTVFRILLLIGTILCLILAGKSLYKDTKATDATVSILYERDTWKWLCIAWICLDIERWLKIIMISM